MLILNLFTQFDLTLSLNLFSPITQYIFTYHFLFATLTNSRLILTNKIKLSQQKKMFPYPNAQLPPLWDYLPKLIATLDRKFSVSVSVSAEISVSEWVSFSGCSAFRFRFKIRFRSITNCNTEYSKVWSTVRALQ